MSAQTTKIEEPRVPVIIMTDRWSLADWVEGWALDPDCMDFAVFVSAWALNAEDVVVTVSARLGYGSHRPKTETQRQASSRRCVRLNRGTIGRRSRHQAGRATRAGFDFEAAAAGAGVGTGAAAAG